MRVVFMGTPDFAVHTLRALVSSRHEVVLVVTQPDRPKGRGKAVQFPPVKEAALEYGIPVIQPEKVRDEEVKEQLRELVPDVIVVAAFGQFLPKRILELPPYGCINVHASLLPKYRGAAPIQWAVINGEPVSGVTTMYMSRKMDQGDMLLKEELTLAPDETGESLFDKLARLSGPLLLRTLEQLEAHTAVRIPQREEDSSYAPMLTKQMGKIDWSRPAVELERLVRGLNSWPSAYTSLDGKTMKIWKAACESDAAEEPQEPGTIVRVDRNSLAVQTGEGRLVLLEVQLDGKKRMTMDAFLRGYSVAVGKRMGEESECK